MNSSQKQPTSQTDTKTPDAETQGGTTKPGTTKILEKKTPLTGEQLDPMPFWCRVGFHKWTKWKAEKVLHHTTIPGYQKLPGEYLTGDIDKIAEMCKPYTHTLVKKQIRRKCLLCHDEQLKEVT